MPSRPVARPAVLSATGRSRENAEHGPPSDRRCGSPRGEQLVAAFEALKGLFVLLVGFGLLSVVNQDLAQVAEELVGHFHLNPASHYPRIFLELARRASDLRLWVFALFAFAYASLRMAEAYGLWRGRRWAEWLAVASGALYVPIEIYELFSGLSRIKAATLTANLVIVAYITCVLWRSRRRSAHATAEHPRCVLN